MLHLTQLLWVQHPTLLKGQIRGTQTKQRHSETNRSFGQMDLKDIYRTFHPQKNILSSQHLMVPSPKLTI